MSSASFPLPTSLRNQRAQERAEPSFSNRAQTFRYVGRSQDLRVSYRSSLGKHLIPDLPCLPRIYFSNHVRRGVVVDGREGRGGFQNGWRCIVPLPPPSSPPFSPLSYTVDGIRGNNHY